MGNVTRQLGEIDRHLHKDEIISLAGDHAQSIIDNKNQNVLSAYVELKRYETYLKGLIAQLKASALNIAAENGEDKFNYDDATVRITHRVRWDYSTDSRWVGIHQLLQELGDEKKEREDFLRENNNKPTVVDPDTGEVIDPYQLSKEVAHGIAIQL
jgi:hypothetical protein